MIHKKAFPKQGKLIELGCGAGNLSIYFAQKGYEVTGNEIPETADWQNHFDRQTRCTIYHCLATRYIGYSNNILQEIIQANVALLNLVC